MNSGLHDPAVECTASCRGLSNIRISSTEVKRLFISYDKAHCENPPTKVRFKQRYHTISEAACSANSFTFFKYRALLTSPRAAKHLSAINKCLSSNASLLRVFHIASVSGTISRVSRKETALKNKDMAELSPWWLHKYAKLWKKSKNFWQFLLNNYGR